MRIGIIVVVYSDFPALVFDSIIGQTIHELTWYLYCHSSNERIEQGLINFCQSNKSHLWLYRDNRGLARSWNDGILSSYRDENDFTFVINDDVCFREHAFDQFVGFLMDKPVFALGFLYGDEPATEEIPRQVRSQDFACFAFGLLAYLKVGAFDENFFPAYKEDTDYHIRIKKLNLPVIIDSRVLVDHQRSSTIRRSPEVKAIIDAAGHANNAYIFRKWGWNDSGPTYNGQFETRGCFIPWESRHAPFKQGFDREDLAPNKPPVLHIKYGDDPDDWRLNAAMERIIARHKTTCEFVVQAVYRSLLKRDAEPGAIARYSEEFMAGQRSIAEFSDEVRRSPEYRSKFDLYRGSE